MRVGIEYPRTLTCDVSVHDGGANLSHVVREMESQGDGYRVWTAKKKDVVAIQIMWFRTF